jgi:hypothetical protein
MLQSYATCFIQCNKEFPGFAWGQSNFEESGSMSPVFAVCVATGFCATKLLQLRLLLLFSGCDQASLRGQQA